MRKFRIAFATITLFSVLVFTPSTGCLEEQKSTVACYFSSRQECKPAVLNLLGLIESSVDIAIYGLTEEDITNRIIQLHKSKIAIRVIADKLQSKGKYSKVKDLQRAKVPLKIMSGFSGGIMHHKYLVVDRKVVLTGSYNFTTGATKCNYENFVIIRSKEVAERYLEEFERMWNK